MSVLGVNPFGVSPLGGPGNIAVRGVVIVGNNQLIVVFDTPPEGLDSQSRRSAVNPKNYVLQALDPTIIAENGDVVVPEGERVPMYQPVVAVAAIDVDDPTQVILETDFRLESGVRYQIGVRTTIEGADGETFFGDSTFEFPAPAPELPPDRVKDEEQIEERFRDFAYSIFPDPDDRSNPVQVYEFDENGDIALQSADASLRKRILRRILTTPGSFSFLPGYGVGVALKRLVKTANLQELSNSIADQAKREPDVSNAAASVSTTRTSAGTFVNIDVFVVKATREERRFLYQIPRVEL